MSSSSKQDNTTTFIMTYDLPNGGGKMHFRPDRITHVDSTTITLKGVEASSNTKVDVNLPIRSFKKMLQDHPYEMMFLVDDWLMKETET